MLNTIGYEKADLTDFIQSLCQADVEVLVDVRDRAQSRRKGFSKTALSNALTEAGIKYVHLKTLGDPKEGREAARAGQWDKFDRIYRGVLRSQPAQLAIDQIIDLLEVSSVCLLCYERDHKTCHRKYISDEIDKRLGKKTRHLGVRKFELAA